jgi:hypothetical protein
MSRDDTEITIQATKAALDVIDEAFGMQKSSSPLGDSLANNIHAAIISAITQYRETEEQT